MADAANPLVAIIMGSTSDWGTMRPASEMLTNWAWSTSVKYSRHTAHPTRRANTPERPRSAGSK